MADVRETKDKGCSTADVLNFLKTMFDQMNKHFDEWNTKLDEQNNKFDELKVDINAGSDSCESNFKELE